MPNVKQNNKNSVPANASSRPNTSRSRNNRKNRTQGPKSRNGNRPGNSKRTPDTIISALSKSMAQTSLNAKYSANPYVAARLACCLPKVTPSIPDGSTSKHISVCLYATDRITFTGLGPQTTLLQFNPWIPTPVTLCNNFNNTVVNGGVYTSGPAGLGLPAAWASLPFAYMRPGSSSNGVDLYNATSCRIVSQTHTIRYVGPVTTCSGLIRSWQNDWSITPIGATTATSGTSTAPAVGTSVQVLSASGTYVSWAPLGTEILQIDSSLSAVPPPSSVCTRPENGMTIRLAHKTGKYEAVPVRNIPPALVPYAGSTSTTTAVNMNHFFREQNTGASTSTCPNVIAYDNDWVSQAVLLENVNDDGAYCIETCICVEFSPLTSSAFYPLAKASPAKDLAAIEHVQRVINTDGSALPGIHDSVGPR